MTPAEHVEAALAIEALRVGILDLDALRLIPRDGLTVEGAPNAIASFKSAHRGLFRPDVRELDPISYGKAKTAALKHLRQVSKPPAPPPGTPLPADAREYRKRKSDAIRRLRGSR